jgi:hypothetical protein
MTKTCTQYIKKPSYALNRNIALKRKAHHAATRVVYGDVHDSRRATANKRCKLQLICADTPMAVKPTAPLQEMAKATA